MNHTKGFVVTFTHRRTGQTETFICLDLTGVLHFLPISCFLEVEHYYCRHAFIEAADILGHGCGEVSTTVGDIGCKVSRYKAVL